MALPAAEILSASESGISRAATLLREGNLVSFPTETVYGLGADARSDQAVAAIYEAKGRPSFNPLIVHLADVELASEFAQMSEDAIQLANAFWPGALSLVVPLREGHGLSPLVTAGLPTVALRVPDQPAARALLKDFGGPVAAPSANPSGRISPTTAQHVIGGLGHLVSAILDAGPCRVGLESTIVGFQGGPTLLRPGGVSTEDIEAVLGQPLKVAQSGEITAPGQLVSHYAPNAAVRLNAKQARANELLLGFGDMDCDINLSPTGDLIEAAAGLFDALHRLDQSGRPIAVARIPDTGLGQAINDRLSRAAAPRNGA